ncbi:hypothetical protein Ancab_027807, partial [Ancistrocladus abbreviatus]
MWHCPGSGPVACEWSASVWLGWFCFSVWLAPHAVPAESSRCWHLCCAAHRGLCLAGRHSGSPATVAMG